MVKQILTYARGGEGKRVDLELKPVLGEVQRVVMHTFPKAVKIEVNCPRDLWSIRSDATQLHQLLMNLCVNARDAMPDGGLIRITAENKFLTEVDLRDHPDTPSGRYVVLTVADTGSGIPPHVLERIFDPFFTTKAYGKGTGLGLATVLGIVKGHGGFIRVDTEVNGGTRMKVHFPAPPVATSPSASRGLRPAIPSEGQQTILLVDDEAYVRDTVSRHLQAFGYAVLAAGSGREALELYRANATRVRLVLTDMMMPEMDGKATIGALRELAPALPVVVMSGLPVDLPVGSPGRHSIHAVLLKPFKTEELLQALESALTA